ncbi:hypothetical protein TD95_003472 [Thielaviopsis punctulata]|uniref:Rad4 beta-hairpin domain-containing protein n=1 Tax=Thielaviopsis punctulata TaxID=72032 RepID=A0A0F4ZBQ6_9PEZI|nr:hypothetical protein TD95_003472 [Thielaviopsis punctulata]
MSPRITRKRLHDEDKDKKPAPAAPARRKPTLYDSLDASVSNSAADSPLDALAKKSGKADEDSDLSSLSDDDDDDMFEDVPLAKRAKVDAVGAGESDEEEDSDDDMVFEDVPAPLPDFDVGPAPTGDLELTLRKDTRISMINSEKKGPTKRARQARILTHCMHVQFLLWHNTVRNAWLCDPEVQAIMISHIPPRIWGDIERWRLASGLDQPARKETRRTAKGKGKMTPAEQVLEQVATDPGKDPLFRLMQTLVGWWKQRFHVTQPGLRKRGYMELERLDRLEKGWAADRTDASRFGERIENLEAFRECAQKLEGSRDLGAQLFTALVRGLGLEARLVANLQPLGFGWNKLEEADPEQEIKTTAGSAAVESTAKLSHKPKPKPKASKPKPKKEPEPAKGKRNPARQSRTQQVIADSEAELDGDDDDLAMEFEDSDDASVMDIDLSAPKTLKPTQKYDADLEFPIYWTEVLSPVTNKYIPIDATVKKVIGSTRELIELLEPRGSKAEKARQVVAYVIGHSADGTAKDVTVRYLRKQVFPGRTKGFRMAIEKIAIRNRHGKIKRYEQFDWLAKVMACFARGTDSKRWPITDADLLEDAEDLTPAIPEKKEVKEGEETLAYFKASTEFVLERHLKREEALIPDAEPVRMFKTRVKGQANEEPVYRRVDVVQVKSAETWHKQGRAPMEGEMPLKRVPYRAATTNRRRELAEAEAATGQKMLQGLYSMEQTDWIIPDPIRDGIIPKNEYGNIDLFAAHMCPQGAVHIPYRGAMRACKKLGFDYAEAVVDFEFGHRMAVPVIHGVVCAEEHYDAVLDQIRSDEAERQRKEDEKRQKAALAMWRKFLKGLRVVEQVSRDYGGKMVGFQVFGRNHRRPEEVQKELEERQRHMEVEEGLGGGFIPEGFEEDVEEDKGKKHPTQTSSFFPVVDEEDDDDGGLVVEDHQMMQAESEPQSEPEIPAEALDSQDELSDLEDEFDADSDFEAEMQLPEMATRRSTRKR